MAKRAITTGMTDKDPISSRNEREGRAWPVPTRARSNEMASANDMLTSETTAKTAHTALRP